MPDLVRGPSKEGDRQNGNVEFQCQGEFLSSSATSTNGQDCHDFGVNSRWPNGLILTPKDSLVSVFRDVRSGYVFTCNRTRNGPTWLGREPGRTATWDSVAGKLHRDAWLVSVQIADIIEREQDALLYPRHPHSHHSIPGLTTSADSLDLPNQI